MSFQRLLRIDWDVVAGVLAAVMAMLLSFMGMAGDSVVRGIILLLCALLLIRDLRSEARDQHIVERVDGNRQRLETLRQAMEADAAMLIGPKRLRQEFVRFADNAAGQVIWLNVCCQMFRRQEIFDVTLSLLLQNERVRSVQLLCDPHEQQAWRDVVVPKVELSAGRDKLAEPLWGCFAPGVSILLTERDAGDEATALVAVLEEPFIAASRSSRMPRYLLRVGAQSEFFGSLLESVRHATITFAHDRATAQPPSAA